MKKQLNFKTLIYSNLKTALFVEEQMGLSADYYNSHVAAVLLYVCPCDLASWYY